MKCFLVARIEQEQSTPLGPKIIYLEYNLGIIHVFHALIAVARGCCLSPEAARPSDGADVNAMK